MNPSSPSITSSALSYLDRATKAISSLGFAPQSDQPIVGLVQELQVIDETKALVVARVLAQGGSFNSAIRSQVADMSVGTRHEAIVKAFDSILEDSKNIQKQADEGRNGLREKVGRVIMKITRGSVHSRFDKIKELYLSVSKDTKIQLDKEGMILEAYLDYRGALKEASIDAAQMFKVQEGRLKIAQDELAAAQTAVGQAELGEAKSRAELVRDEKQRVLATEDRRYQLIKDMDEQLSLQYNVGETLMANLSQTRNVKRAGYEDQLTKIRSLERKFSSNNYDSSKARFDSSLDTNSLIIGYLAGRQSEASIFQTFESSHSTYREPEPDYSSYRSSSSSSSSDSSSSYSSSSSSSWDSGSSSSSSSYDSGGSFGGGDSSSGGGF